MQKPSDGLSRLLLTPPEAAQVLRISERKPWGLTASGQITHVRIGRSGPYDLDDLKSWIDDRKGVRQ